MADTPSDPRAPTPLDTLFLDWLMALSIDAQEAISVRDIAKLRDKVAVFLEGERAAARAAGVAAQPAKKRRL